MILSRPITVALLAATWSALVPCPAFASGYGDLRGVGAMMIAIAVGILNALVFAAVVVIHRRYTLWSVSRALCLALVFLLSETIVLALNNLLWDRIYSGEHYEFVAAGLNVLYPAVFLAFLRAFRKDCPNRTVWKIDATIGAAFAAVSLIWFIAEGVYG